MGRTKGETSVKKPPVPDLSLFGPKLRNETVKYKFM